MIKNKNNTKKILILALATLLLCAAGLLAYRLASNNSASDVRESDGINYGPPTEEEKRQADEQKKDVEEAQNKENSPASTPTATKSVSVIITDAAQYDDIIEVRSFIPDHYQDGTCTITFTKDNLTLSKETPAYKDASTTICTNPEFKSSEFKTKGTWKVVVSYESANATGTSAPQEVVIK